MTPIYLDNAATTPLDPKVLEAMKPYFLEKYGNASSLHSFGQEAKRVLEESREIVARAIGARYNEIYFTSGGTESNNWVLKGVAFANCGKANRHIITTKVEHDCVLNTCKWLEGRGVRVTYLDVDSEGFVDLEQLKDSITEDTLLVSVIHGHNEVGTIQDLEAIGKICKENNVLFHTDACQSFTKTGLNVKKMNLDFVTLNAHKIHGPKGVGALYVGSGVKLDSLVHGGGQEMKKRSGTENITGIVGFAKSVKLMGNSEVKRIRKLRDKMINGILEIENTRLNGPSGDARLCNNVNVCFGNIEGEAIGMFLDSKGICISTGSACSSKSLEPSHVLLAMGLVPQDANSSVRISLGKFNTEQEVEYFLEELKKVVDKLRRMSPLVG